MEKNNNKNKVKLPNWLITLLGITILLGIGLIVFGFGIFYADEESFVYHNTTFLIGFLTFGFIAIFSSSAYGISFWQNDKNHKELIRKENDNHDKIVKLEEKNHKEIIEQNNKFSKINFLNNRLSEYEKMIRTNESWIRKNEEKWYSELFELEKNIWNLESKLLNSHDNDLEKRIEYYKNKLNLSEEMIDNFKNGEIYLKILNDIESDINSTKKIREEITSLLVDKNN